MKKKIFGILLLLLSIFVVSSCGKNIEVNKQPIEHETKFGGIYIKMTIDEFNNKGFKFGDSLNI